MAKVGSVLGSPAVQWLHRLGEYECWARHKFDPNLHSPETSSNFVESFNSTLGADRSLPVLALLEGIFHLPLVLVLCVTSFKFPNDVV